MSDYIVRPGPERIGPMECPGGIVIHVYRVPDQALLMVRRLSPDMPLASMARADADSVTAAEVCLVAFDGDDGSRIDLAAVFGVRFL